jgi:hypothetical protein
MMMNDEGGIIKVEAGQECELTSPSPASFTAHHSSRRITVKAK